MYIIGNYKETDRMSDLICEKYQMLLVMSRFGISLGFGDKSISEVCEDNGVDTRTFLAVVNLLVNEDKRPEVEKNHLSIEALVQYLKNSHTYFLDFKLPSIREKLMEAIDHENDNVALAIIRYYDEYAEEVSNHMMYEEKIVFPYIQSLLDNNRKKQYNIDIFIKRHDSVEFKLSELKNIIIKYYPSRSSNELNSVLFDIFSCSRDLASHNDVEDRLLVPAVKSLELKMEGK